MDWLNYHHLHYFWRVAREGSLTRASAALRLSPSTVSAQIQSLERSLGLAEAMDEAHNGRNLGHSPVTILAVFIGTQGVPASVPAPPPARQ